MITKTGYEYVITKQTTTFTRQKQARILSELDVGKKAMLCEKKKSS